MFHKIGGGIWVYLFSDYWATGLLGYWITGLLDYWVNGDCMGSGF
jgi:hypothetical protein